MVSPRPPLTPVDYVPPAVDITDGEPEIVTVEALTLINWRGEAFYAPLGYVAENWAGEPVTQDAAGNSLNNLAHHFSCTLAEAIALENEGRVRRL